MVDTSLVLQLLFTPASRVSSENTYFHSKCTPRLRQYFLIALRVLLADILFESILALVAPLACATIVLQQPANVASSSPVTLTWASNDPTNDPYV